jgi:glutamyl-tRNA synthetase
VQIALFQALGAELPRFGHHNLLQSETGEGLSKRLASLSVESLRAEGLEPLAVASLAALIGTSEAVRPVGSLQELGTLFALEKVNRSPSRFAPDELRSLNAKTLAQLPFKVVRDRLAALGVGGGEAFWNVVRGNIGTLAEALEWWQVAQGHVDPVVAPEDHDFIQTAAGLLPDEPWSEATWSEWTNRLKERTGRKGRGLFMPLRLALTGLSSGPELAPLLPFLGRPNTLARLRGPGDHPPSPPLT